MKKILYSVFMLATMVLAACSSEDTTEPDVKRGMVLKANVEDTDTRATITDNEGKWKFAFATNDKVKVGNDQVESYYTFTNNGTVFASADAKQTAEAANWCAFFPGETIDLTNQSGDFADVANKYALAGATATATTGSDGLTVTMKAKVAVLCIVGVNKDDILDISVKTDDGYVSGLKADKNSADFKVETKDTKVSLLSKQGAGVYYIVVPAGVKISVYNGNEPLYSGDKPMSTTKADGLKAGKYYTLTTGMTKGSAENKLGDTIGWVQLWPGGPKFATENVESKLNWSQATAEGSDYVWGANWRTPTKDEMNFVDAKKGSDGYYTLNSLNTKAEVKVQGGKVGYLYTGIQPGYTDKTIFLPAQDGTDESYFHGLYWSSTVINKTPGVSFEFFGGGGVLVKYELNENAHTTSDTQLFVRPVLNE
ncbi:hypothetical protein [Leyella stercorea]